jgi:hypothetical protein
MMSEPTVVDARLDKLEQDNRRLKLTVGALLLVLAAVPLIGAVMPQQIPELIQAREFQTVDRNGTMRASMSNSGFHYRDNNGTLIASMGQFFRGTGFRAQAFGGLRLYDENGTARVDISDYAITYHDENNILRAVMRANAITHYDENDNIVWSTLCAPNCPGGGRLH